MLTTGPGRRVVVVMSWRRMVLGLAVLGLALAGGAGCTASPAAVPVTASPPAGRAAPDIGGAAAVAEWGRPGDPGRGRVPVGDQPAIEGLTDRDRALPGQ